jgi:hypothetical protein
LISEARMNRKAKYLVAAAVLLALVLLAWWGGARLLHRIAEHHARHAH